MKALIERTILVVVVLLVALPVMAQGAPPATPIDGGLSLLLAAGGVYGIKKIRDSL
ncbi:PID-CTERM protein-sorting domain-containing protein [Marinoscillum furvescens]|nr:hypothetical protein [Marinoscillum furvescens]